MEGGYINLKSSDFLANIFSSFNDLHNSELFTDVTLVSDDNKKIQAHKLVLSAGSEYFRDILSDKSHPHPMLCLEGVSSVDLAYIIKYLYVGEVSVAQSSFQKFLKIGKKFKCFGLSEDGPQMEKSAGDNFGNDISYIIENENVPKVSPIEDPTFFNTNCIVNICDDGDKGLEKEITNEPLTDLNEDTKETINNLESKYFGHNKDRHNGPEMEKSDGVFVSNEISHIAENDPKDLSL